MRTVILILIIAVVALILAIASGFIDISQTRDARAPELSADGNGVTASGGQAPAFDVETGKVAIGARDKNVTMKVPTVEIRQPAEQTNETATANSSN
jgi:hypothetical protein